MSILQLTRKGLSKELLHKYGKLEEIEIQMAFGRDFKTVDYHAVIECDDNNRFTDAIKRSLINTIARSKAEYVLMDISEKVSVMMIDLVRESGKSVVFGLEGDDKIYVKTSCSIPSSNIPLDSLGFAN